MVKFSYPSKQTLKNFIEVIVEGNYSIRRYLPHIDDEWHQIINDCIAYVVSTSAYTGDTTIYQESANLIYKIAKRHELGDGNKRSAVIATYCFCLINGYWINDPQKLKRQAKRIASTRGRQNEEMMKRRVASSLERIIIINSTN